MPASKTRVALSHMLEPLSEDELEPTAFENTIDSSVENINPIPPSRARAATKGKTSSSSKVASGRATTSKVSKTKAQSRRGSGGGVATNSRKTASKRSALAERNAPNESDTEEVDEFDETEVPVQKPKSRRVRDDDEPEKPARKRAPKLTAASSRGKTSKRAPSAEPHHRLVPETQPEPMDIEPSVEEITEYPVEPPPRAIPRAQSRQRSDSQSRAAQHGSRARQTSVPRSRAGSVSDPERRTHDPALRRKLGEITKKFENLDLKYRQLKEVGVKSAETNFEKLRKTTEQRAKDQDAVIASLKKELATVRESQSDSKSMRLKIASLETDNQRLTNENTRLTTESKSQSSSLADTQNEMKALNAKLSQSQMKLQAAEKAVETAAANAKVPGSVVKGGQKNALNANGSINADIAMYKLKEELYSDLTGLMVRNVKKMDGEDLFDCIQTGRNGTLHFHLSIPSVPTSADGGANFEDQEFAYTPLLDEKNDRALIEILPDYLTEEICFPRSSAAKFYSKVLDSMSRKVVVE